MKPSPSDAKYRAAVPAGSEARVVAPAASLDASEQIVSSDPQKPSAKSPVPAAQAASSAIKNEAKPASTPSRPDSKAETKAEPKPEAKPEPKPEARAESKAPPPKPDDGARAKALLEGREPAKPEAASSEQRFIIQVGAFAENDKAHDVRVKLERAGLKTYVHVAETKDGKRIRVRLGPFATRAEAEKAAGKVKALQLPAAILIL